MRKKVWSLVISSWSFAICYSLFIIRSLDRAVSFFIFHFSFFIIHYSLFASSPYQILPETQSAFQEICKLKIEPLPKNSQNAFQIYTENYADMVALLVSDDMVLYKKIADRENERLNILEGFSSDSPYYRFYQAEIRLHWAFVKLKFGKEVSGSWDIIKAFKLLDENAKKYPAFIPTYKSLGLLHVLIGATPKNYLWVAKLLGLNGNIQLGLKELRLVQQKDTLFKNEAQLIELLVHSYITKYTDRQNDELLKFIGQNPDNLLFYFFGTTISMKDARSEQALAILNKCPSGTAYLPFPFLDYLRAEILLQKGQSTSAQPLYQQFLSRYRGQNFVKDTYYKLFLCQWFSGNEVAAKKMAQDILSKGQTVVESDKAAQKFAEKYVKNGISGQQKILMKARLAFDGGYLNEAFSLLSPLSEGSFSGLYDKAEYQYRLGRLLHRQNQFNKAVVCYERAMTLSVENHYYFGATAALQLGYIYQLRKQEEKAREYFEIALDYPSHEYKNSIDNKAKAALNEMGE